MQAQDDGDAAVLAGHVVDESKIAVGIHESQCVHGTRAERIEFVGALEVVSRPGHLVIAQQVDADVLVCRGESRLDVDRFLVQIDRVAIAAGDDVKMCRKRMDLAPVRIVGQ